MMNTWIKALQALTVLVVALVIAGCFYASQQTEAHTNNAPITVQADAQTCPHADGGQC